MCERSHSDGGTFPRALRAILLALVMTPWMVAKARAATTVDAHLEARQSALGQQQEAARTLVRQHAWMAYRLARQRELGFFGDPKRRPDDARAVAMAVVVLQRSLHEAQKLSDEQARVQQERAALALRTSPMRETATGFLTQELDWPVKGPIIGAPGLRTDAVTGVIYREAGLHILARVDAPVVSPAAGTVRRVELLPMGGYAAVISHAVGSTTVLAGLKTVDVSAGDTVAAGQRMGRVGRTLDGAPVLRFALWQDGVVVDPRGLRVVRR